ncbi:MAG: hypothetical protein MJE68_02050 [Proteobacteria bacterium]|nr:hypothetical protein [Pseudomonadota bacterium]
MRGQGDVAGDGRGGGLGAGDTKGEEEVGFDLGEGLCYLRGGFAFWF